MTGGIISGINKSEKVVFIDCLFYYLGLLTPSQVLHQVSRLKLQFCSRRLVGLIDINILTEGYFLRDGSEVNYFPEAPLKESNLII